VRRRSAAVAVLTVVLATWTTTAASAAWDVRGVGPGQAAAGVLPASPVPVVSEQTVLGVRTVTVTWPAPPDGVPLTGWRVVRSGGTGLLGGTCAGVRTPLGVSGVLTTVGLTGAVSCTDPATGSVRYAVAPVAGTWVGEPSAWSLPTG
jgi:hypothetical protein